MPIQPKYNLLFIHIPKSGGSTVEYFLGMTSRPFLYLEREFQFEEGNFALQHLNYTQIQKYTDLDLSNYTKFTFVRNPYHRAISLFSYNVKHQYYTPKVSRNFTNEEFSNFLTTFISQRNSSHKLNQSYYLDCEYDFIGRVENFDEDFSNFISKHTDLTYTPRKVNVSKESTSELFKTLSRENIDLVNELYKEDFDNLGYKMI